MNIFLNRCTSHLDVFSVFLLDIPPSLITGFWLGFAVVQNWQDPELTVVKNWLSSRNRVGSLLFLLWAASLVKALSLHSLGSFWTAPLSVVLGPVMQLSHTVSHPIPILKPWLWDWGTLASIISSHNVILTSWCC